MLFILSLLGCSSSNKTVVDSANISSVVQDADGDGFDAEEDCNDQEALINPSVEELCDGSDNNCDGNIDEGVLNTYYVDADGDGFGTESLPIDACEPPNGFVSSNTDCDDTSAQTFPNADEICDGRDNNCDGNIDEGLLSNFFVDADGDGFGNPEQTTEACDLDLGISSIAGDCNDGDALQNPLMNEICDNVDNNCNGNIDEGLLNTYYIDIDEDGFGDESTSILACEAPYGYIERGEDCDDIESFANPFATEKCDGIDNNCDGNIDEESALDAHEYYRDNDGDLFGAGQVFRGCIVPAGYSIVGGDCDDTIINVHPSMVELCDGLDNNCDGLIDDDASINQYTWYADTDGDGFGDANTTQSSCNQPTGYVLNDSDCDDQNIEIHPNALEICDSIDNNCNGSIDMQDGSITDALTWYLDHDQDSFGDANFTQLSCSQPNGYVSNADDCNDLNQAQSPTQMEYCNAIDDNCDGITDENTAIDASIWYADDDTDGFGAVNDSTYACTQPTGHVANSIDCNDLDIDIHPDADEICDEIDNNCDGSIDELPELIGSEALCAAQSCLDIHEQNSTASDGVYWIDPIQNAPYQVYCDMTRNGGGWTLLLKSNGDALLDYDNALWTDSNTLNETSIDNSSANAKFSSFNELDITELMGCFPTQGNHCFFANISSANTAREIFSGGSQQMGSGWNGQSYSGWSWQPNCHYFGINTPYCYQRARFGFTANQEGDCNSNDTAIGFGLARTCGADAASSKGSGNLCLSSGCSQGPTINVGFMGLLYGR